MDFKFLFIGTVLFITHITSSPIISYYNNKEGIIEDVKDTKGRYEVTENVIDIPDDRTLAPIVANFSLNTALNYGNATVKQNKTLNKEENNPNNEAVNKPIKETSNKETDNNLKKNQFSILHIKAEYEDNHKVDNNDKCRHVFVCLKDYLNGVKKGLVDGVQSFFRGHKEKPSILDKFHRNVDSDESDDEGHSFSDEFDDEFKF